MRQPAWALVGLALVAGCSDNAVSVDAMPAVCGDGIATSPEQCDDGNQDQTDACRNCRSFQPARTLIRWLFNADMPRGFIGDGCTDVAAASVRVDLSGAGAATLTAPCDRFQVTFDGLGAGDYTASVTPLDSNGASLLRVPVTTTFTANTATNSTEQYQVVVPPTAWARAYTGTFLFMFRWRGQNCTGAQPPVTRQRVLMKIGGVPVTTTTMWNNQPGYKLDGMVAAPCVLSTISLAERANALPFGPATLSVIGTDALGTNRFSGSFETFVGAGTANPVLTFDVQTAVDAGVDAPIDAPIDAP